MSERFELEGTGVMVWPAMAGDAGVGDGARDEGDEEVMVYGLPPREG